MICLGIEGEVDHLFSLPPQATSLRLILSKLLQVRPVDKTHVSRRIRSARYPGLGAGGGLGRLHDVAPGNPPTTPGRYDRDVHRCALSVTEQL